MSDEPDQPASSAIERPDQATIDDFWSRFLLDSDLDPTTPTPPAWCFGDSVELADELIALVVDGPKRATAGAVADYEADGEPLPKVGDHSIVTDGSMRPRVVLETTDVRVGPLSSVDDEFAWDEGEDDRTRDSWMANHTAYFSRRYEQLGLSFHDEIPVVFERFDVRYREDPPEAGGS